MKPLIILLLIIVSTAVFGRATSPYETSEEQTYYDTVDASVLAIETVANGKILMGNGSNVGTEVTPSGDVTMTNAGVNAIANGVIVETDVTAQVEGLNLVRMAIFDYDFAVDGGSQGAIATGVSLPAKAIIEKCWFRIETQLVDGGAGTHAWSCEDANNILTAADQTGVAAGAFLASNATGTAATMVDNIAASCNITFTIAGSDLSAGKMRGWCRYSVHP